jgi:hypothetical protein
MLQPESGARGGTARWLVLLYQLPTRSSSARVRVWRRLQDIGAVQVRQSAYVLPNHEAAREDLEWVRSEVVGLGGAATLFVADAGDAAADAELVAACREARARDAAAVQRQAGRWVARADRLQARQQPLTTALAREARALVGRWRALSAVTYFDAPGMTETEDIVQQIVQRSSGRRAGSAPAGAPALTPTAYRGRTWVTRPRPGVDRMSTAWLIRTHIDPMAKFVFAETPPADAVPFDMYGVEFGHQGDRCSFEVVADRFGVRTPRVAWMGRVVHDIDLREARYNEPETAGVALMVEGLRRTHADDLTLLEHGIGLFESLAQARADLAPAAAAGRTPGRARAASRRASPRKA